MTALTDTEQCIVDTLVAQDNKPMTLRSLYIATYGSGSDMGVYYRPYFQAHMSLRKKGVITQFSNSLWMLNAPVEEETQPVHDAVNERALERLKAAGATGMTETQMNKVFQEEIEREACQPYVIKAVLENYKDTFGLTELSEKVGIREDIITACVERLAAIRANGRKRPILDFSERRATQTKSEEPKLYHQQLGHEIAITPVVCDVYNEIEGYCLTAQQIANRLNVIYPEIYQRRVGDRQAKFSRGTAAYILNALVEVGLLRKGKYDGKLGYTVNTSAKGVGLRKLRNRLVAGKSTHSGRVHDWLRDVEIKHEAVWLKKYDNDPVRKLEVIDWLGANCKLGWYTNYWSSTFMVYIEDHSEFTMFYLMWGEEDIHLMKREGKGWTRKT